MDGRRLALYGGFYLAALFVAAGVATWRPELALEARTWGSLVGSVPLGWSALGGEQLWEMRMQSRWWLFLPKYHLLPGMACFFVGFFVLFEVFRLALMQLTAIR